MGCEDGVELWGGCVGCEGCEGEGVAGVRVARTGDYEEGGCGVEGGVVGVGWRWGGWLWILVGMGT